MKFIGEIVFFILDIFLFSFIIVSMNDKLAPMKNIFFGITVSEYERKIVLQEVRNTGESKSATIRRIIREWDEAQRKSAISGKEEGRS